MELNSVDFFRCRINWIRLEGVGISSFSRFCVSFRLKFGSSKIFASFGVAAGSVWFSGVILHLIRYKTIIINKGIATMAFLRMARHTDKSIASWPEKNQKREY